ncbi:hypothetical protein AVEN_255184-1 [Araneus ventricosus]|uniref:Uncharacterized protein n=1 Tax=Araneus ventricosus TaxID=182803 RepID=A0A4Y2BC45_ARAVE|nr:hypothetical protein AVEN_255184-1 [Araneus ventricosus]
MNDQLAISEGQIKAILSDPMVEIDAKHKRVTPVQRPVMRRKNMNDAAATTINRELWLPYYSPHCKQLFRRPLRERYDPSSLGVTRTTPLLYPTEKRDSAYLYGKFSSPYMRRPLKLEEYNVTYRILKYF